MVQGDALGGGLESALSMDMIVAERSAKMGLPEILFNLFPGMGAYSFLSRKLDAARAEKMILSGRVYSAEELHEMGVVDVLVEDGQGEEGIREYIDRQTYRHNAYRGVFQMRRRVNTIPKEELIDVVDIWVDAVLNLKEADIRKMARLTAAQDRRRVAMAAASIAAISANRVGPGRDIYVVDCLCRVGSAAGITLRGMAGPTGLALPRTIFRAPCGRLSFCFRSARSRYGDRVAFAGSVPARS